MWQGDQRRREAVVLAGGAGVTRRLSYPTRDPHSVRGRPQQRRPPHRRHHAAAGDCETAGRADGPGDPPASTAPPAGTAASGRSRWSNSACCRDMGWRDCPPSGPRNGPVVRAGGGLPARASPHAPPQPLLPIRPATDVTQLPPPWRSSRIATAPRLPLPWGAASSGLSVCRRVLPQSAAGGHPRVEAEHLAPRR